VGRRAATRPSADRLQLRARRRSGQHYGDLYVLEQLWRRLGLPEVLASVLADRKFDFDVERALFAMVANRALAPASKLYCYTQWLQEEVRNCQESCV
jgi:hypothetical protein